MCAISSLCYISLRRGQKDPAWEGEGGGGGGGGVGRRKNADGKMYYPPVIPRGGRGAIPGLLEGKQFPNGGIYIYLYMCV